MSNSTSSTRVRKPAKPYRDFPLSPHASGKWCKRILGKLHYFGRWAHTVKGELVPVDGNGWKGALELFQAQQEALYAGRTPREKKPDELVLRDLCNAFLDAKLNKVKIGKLSKRTFVDYREICDVLIGQFGRQKPVDDFGIDDFTLLRASMARRWGVVRLGNSVQRVKTVFKWGFASDLIKEETKFGPEFRKPPENVLQEHKYKNGSKLFTADEIHKLLNVADKQMTAMILLGVNAAYGNTDITRLPVSALDLEGGLATVPRPKTKVRRRCPLWKETIESLKALEIQGERVFGLSQDSAVLSKKFRALMEEVGIYQPRRNFYNLRHCFRTHADGCMDITAIRCVMGHKDKSTDATYTHTISDSRLVAVTEHVRNWLFGEGGE